MADKGIALTWTDALKEYLVKKSFSETYGARNLRRLIQKEVEDAIACEIIESYQKNISAMDVTVDDGAVKVNIQ